MKINIKNLGIIKEGAIDTSKRLTLFCGPNSTGKTYLSYLLYFIHSNQCRVISADSNTILGELDNNGRVEITKEHLNQFLLAEAEAIKQNLDTIFSISEETAKKLFNSLKLTTELTDDEYDRIMRDMQYNVTFRKDESSYIVIAKERGSNIVTCTTNNNDGELYLSDFAIPEFVVYHILHTLSHAPIRGVRMLTVERNSIYTFNKELSLTRNELIDTIIDNKNHEDSLREIVERKSKRYPIAIRDSLRIANDLTTIQKFKGDFYELASELEETLLHGSISVNKTGDVEFVMRSSEKRTRTLPIHMTSSIVKTMSSLIIYLKHIAHKEDLVIIDEPEMNMHPNNQIILARIFARLVNAGLRVVISTHSDYIIREFNNMIMLNSLKAKGINPHIEDHASDQYDALEILKPEDVAVLYFGINNQNKVSVKSIPIDDYGFNIESIDNAIDSQNDITDSIFSALKYGEPDD